MVGIGAELNGDDAAGVIVARKLKLLMHEQPDILVLDGGSVPESTIGPLRKFAAQLVVLVDAADIHAEPGTVQWIDQNLITGSGFSTHSMPLTMLCQFMEQEIGCEVLILGIQPANVEFGQPLSVPCRKSANKIAREFKKLICVE